MPRTYTVVPAGSRRPALDLPQRHGVAGVAVAAPPVALHLRAEVLEDEARAAARGLREVDHRLELRLVARAALLVVGEVRAEVHLGEAPAPVEPLPVAAAVLAHEAVP